VPTPLAIAIFLLGLGASLGASEVLVRGLARLGTKLGLAAGLIGLLTALGADSPEISSAITAVLRGAKDVGLGVILGSNLFNLAALLGFSTVVAGQIGFRRILLWLDGGVALWATLIVGLLFLAGLAPVLSLLLILVVFGIYVMLLVVQPHRVDRLALPARVRHRLAAAARLVHRDLERSEREEVEEREELEPVASWVPVWWVVPAVAVIAGGSYAMVSGALALGDRWNISHAILGTVGLAVITSLPNAYAATRLALLGNGTAVVSLAFNSNTLNLLAGVSIPAVFIGGLSSAPSAARDIAWLLAMTVLAIGLGWWQAGLNRLSGGLLIVVYLLFIVFALR
jgi:cation:H+ antiporter